MAQVTKNEQLNMNRVKRIIGQTHLGIAATAINSMILVLVLWGLIPVSRLLLWLSVALSISMIRVFLQFYWKKRVITTGNIKKIRNLFLTTLFVSGCIWGSAGVFLLPSSSIAHQVFIAFVLGGMVAGSVGVFSPIMASYYCFSIPALFPITICFFRMSTEIHSAMGAMVTLFWFIMLMTTRRLNMEMTESLNLKYENVDLISDLEKEIIERKRTEERLTKKNQEIETIVRKRTEELRGVNEILLNEIEEHKVAEKALQESEKLYKGILRTATDGFCLLDSDGRLIDVNDAYCQMTGYSQQELLSMKVSDLEALESPEEVLLHIEKVLCQGEDLFETRQRRKDGSIIDVEVSVGFHPEEKGRLFGFFRDITKRKQEQMEREDLQAQLSNAIEMVRLGPWEYDVTNDLFTFNDHFYKIFHTTAEQVGGYTMSSSEYAQRFLHPDDRHLVEKEVRRLLEETDPNYSYQQEHRILYADGTVGYITVRAFSVKDANGQIVRTYGVNQDVTERKQAEIEQEKLQAQLSNALEIANLAPWEYDIAKDLFTFNDHFYKVFRATAEEVGGYTMSSEEFARRFVHPDDALEPVDAFIDEIDPDSGQILEHRTIYGDGTIGYMSVKLFVAKDSQGKAIRAYGVNQDITESKREEMEREKLRAQLSNAVEIANLAPWEYDVASDLFTFNDIFYKVFHTTADEMGGYTMSSSEFAQRFFHPDEVHGFAERLYQSSEGRDPDVGKRLEHRIIFGDGTPGYVSVIPFLIKDSQGKTVRTYGTTQDITEQKQAEIERENLQAQLSNAVEMVHLGPWEYDVANDLFTFNDHFYKIFRTTVKQVGGYTMSSAEYAQRFLHPGDRGLVGEEIRKMLETTDPNYNRQVEHRIIYTDGTVGYVTVRIFIVKNADGQTVKSYGVNQDITERKRIDEELLKTQKLESTGILAGGIAHDFNNILTTILGNISMAKTNMAPDDEMFDLLSEAETASNRAQALTRQLLTFSKGGTPLKETATIKGMLKESTLFVLRGSKSDCEFSVEEDLWPVDVDVGQISQVIHNVVINANQAMPQGGSIRIEAKNLVIENRHAPPLKPGRYVRISITDQGTGIGKKDLSRIFDPYYTTKQEGSGLGLATSYSIINRHGGHITVESRLEVGTTFHIYLPASDKMVPEKEEDHLIKGRGRILVMDDDAPLRKTLGRMLEKLGYEPGFAEDGIEAIRMLKEAKRSKKPFDAVILDLTVPGGMGGKDALPKMLDIDPEVKAIVASGYSDDPVLAKYKQYGFKGMLPKPFEPLSLSRVLSEVIQGKEGHGITNQ